MNFDNAVREQAGLAQSDIGLDYAWLDDSSYLDWEKYHWLMICTSLYPFLFRLKLTLRFFALPSAVDNYARELRGIQNGTHTDPAPDPLVLALNTLQENMLEVIDSFNSAVRLILDEADILFGNSSGEEVAESASESEGTRPLGPIIAETPHSSADDESVKEAANILVGRGKQEVEDALKRANVIHEEL